MILEEIGKRVELNDKDKFAIGMMLADLVRDKETFKYFENKYKQVLDIKV